MMEHRLEVEMMGLQVRSCYIRMPKNFEYGSAAGMFWLCTVTMNRQILEISQRISVTQV